MVEANVERAITKHRDDSVVAPKGYCGNAAQEEGPGLSPLCDCRNMLQSLAQ